MEAKKPLPSLRGCSQVISRKIIILFTVIIMSLLTCFLPYPISSFTTSYAIENQQTFPIVWKVRENSTINIVETYVAELKQNGYQDVDYELDKEKSEQIWGTQIVQISKQSNSNILNAFNFYANYVQVSKGDNLYYFKTLDNSNKFIDEIKKYDDTKYEIQEKIKKEIGSETKDEILQKTIKKAETAYKAKLAAAAASYTINDLSDISNDAIVQFAIQFVGNPYVYGGTSLTNGADCSGFVQSVYKHFGITLPRGATGQFSAGTKIPLDQIQPGDLLFYNNGGYGIDHVAIYIGGSKIVHAGKPATGINICTANIMTKVGAVRIR